MRHAPAGLFASLALVLGLLAAPAEAQTPLTTKRVAMGLQRPIWVGAPDGDTRLFVAELAGDIEIVKDGVVTGTFLDIGTLVSVGSERGLLGVAFHPQYATNGYLYVHYTDVNGDSVVSRWNVSAGDPDLADPTSELVILTQSQPQANHNAGSIAFGLDGYLYIGMGDGGGANDPQCRAQKGTTWLGKMLRIDVDGGTPYAIPPDNPFVGTEALPEIYHLGLRNPFRFCIDRLTGDMYIGDVGQDAREEIDFAAFGEAGLNFGWKVMEGTKCNSTSNCLPGVPACGNAAYTDPIYELTHQGNPGLRAIIGGCIYRGCQIPDLDGTYFFSDNGDDKVRTFKYDPMTGVSDFMDRTAELQPGRGLTLESMAAFGEDGFGEILIVDNAGNNSGEVYKVVPANAVGAIATPRNGLGGNATCYTSQNLPILGGVWRVEVDATNHPGATLTGVVGRTMPSSGIVLSAGELLIKGVKLFKATQASSGGVDLFEAPLPCDPSLAGATAYTQAFILGGGLELCNAIDASLGFY